MDPQKVHVFCPLQACRSVQKDRQWLLDGLETPKADASLRRDALPGQAMESDLEHTSEKDGTQTNSQKGPVRKATHRKRKWGFNSEEHSASPKKRAGNR